MTLIGFCPKCKRAVYLEVKGGDVVPDPLYCIKHKPKEVEYKRKGRRKNHVVYQMRKPETEEEDS